MAFCYNYRYYHQGGDAEKQIKDDIEVKLWVAMQSQATKHRASDLKIAGVQQNAHPKVFRWVIAPKSKRTPETPGEGDFHSRITAKVTCHDCP